ncbi:hypothetical protein Tco_0146514 [Tanacetum coccineum]
MSNMSKDIQYAGSDTRPPMLDRTDFDSWQQCIRLYCLGKDNGENIMKSITEGSFQMGMVIQTVAEETKGALQPGLECARVFTNLTAEEKERYKADIHAKNILLQGIPKDIYTLINHYTDAKDIWDNVKIILEGSELTKDDRKSQLYDEFERFLQIKGETIHVYYVRFITEVKLNRGLKESNFDQLYAYLKQHEVHANENRMMMKRFIQPTNDLLALVSNALIQQYPTQSSMSQSTNQPSPADNFQLDSRSSSTENLIESLTNSLSLLTQSYKSNLPQINNQLRTSSNARNKATVHDDRVVVQDVRRAGNAGGQNRVGNVNPGEQVTNFDDDVDDPPEQDLALNVDHVFKADQLDAFYSDVDEAPTIHTMFMANLTVYGHHDVHEMQNNIQQDYVVDSEADYTSDSNIILYDQSIIDEMYEEGVQSRIANKQDRVVKDSLNYELAIYKELVGEYEKRAKFELTEREQKIDEQMRIIISDRNRKETSLKSDLHTVQTQLCSILDQYKSKTEEVTILKKDFKHTEDKYLEEFLDMKKLKDKVEDRLYKQDQETLEISKLTRKRMYEKMKSPQCIQNKVKFAPPDYSKENYLAIFAPQRDLTPEQIFWAKDENDRKKVEALVLKPLSTPTVSVDNDEEAVYLLYGSAGVRVITAGMEGVDDGGDGVGRGRGEGACVLCDIWLDLACHMILDSTLLIANENLISNCLSNQLMFAVEQSRCLDLEAEISKLQNENQKDVNDEMIRGFNKLEVVQVITLVSWTQAVQNIDGRGIIPKLKETCVEKFIRGQVYYVKGLGHNLFSVGQFYDSDLEIAFSMHSCFVRDMNGLVRGLPRLKFELSAYHLCSAVVNLEKQKYPTNLKSKNPTIWDSYFIHLHMDLYEKMSLMLVSPRIRSLIPYCKLKAKADIRIFVGYAPSRKGFRIYNKRTRRIIEIIHLTFDELHQTMAPVHISSGPEPMSMTPGQFITRVDEPVPSATVVNAHVVPPVRPLSSDTPITQATIHPQINHVTGDPGYAIGHRRGCSDS